MNPSHIKAPKNFEKMTGEEIKHLAGRFMGYMKPFLSQFILGCVCAVFYGASAAVQPFFIKYLMDDVLKKGNYEPLKWLLILILVSTILKGIFMYAQGFLLSYAGQSAVRHIRDEVNAHLQALPISFFEKWQAGQIMYRVITDIHQMTDTFTQAVIVLIADFFVFLFSVGAMIWIDWRLTLVAFLASPMIAFIMHYFGNLIQKFVSRMQNRVSDLNSLMQENINGIKVIKAFGAEEYEEKRFAEINERSFAAIMKSIQFKLTQTPLVEFFGTIGVIVIIAFGVYLVNMKPSFTAGSFLSFVAFMLMATSPINRFSNTYADLRKGFVSAARVFELLDIPIEAKDSGNARELEGVKGEVIFEDSKFSYDGKTPILKGITFTANPGETVAVVGPNGAGKTTLVNLIPRFYDLTGGKIFIDKNEIRDIKIKSLRSHIGVVLQDTVLFSGTIRDNIAYGNPDIPLEKVKEAAVIANAHDFIEKLPEGYDTTVGEKGVGLSGGQKQRISIARTVLRHPEILILDEATSSLDQESEALVQDALEKLMKGRTTFVIAHKLSTIRGADRILVLNAGRVEEVGKHEELMKKDGLYRKLYEAQKMIEETEEIEQNTEGE
ncbi:MAG: ABC transporter ATP-binding protein/permease [Candidatus Eremiobacteraeota bacterium]|nr:ABC transporter ATP-binding protein/permease [Candidatus Eremiobacteraeota bacterium]